MSEKSEKPTARRLSEAREKGQVVRSQELITAAALIAASMLLQGPGGQMISSMRVLLVDAVNSLPNANLTEASMVQILFKSFGGVIGPLSMFVFGLASVGIVVTLAQTNFLFATKKIGFDFQRINPLSGLKRMFSTQGLFEVAKNLLKLGVVGWVAYSFLQSQITQFIALESMDLEASLRFFAEMALSMMSRVGGAYLVLAIADYGYQYWQFMKSMKMSKQEVKEEMKRSEGDPFIKSRIRGQQRRMARMRMMANVKKATVVITNPTHLAVALQYSDGMSAPKVVAKGAYHIAEKIVGVAKENRVPVTQNVPVARALYKAVEIDQDITPELYMAVAEVLAYVYRINGKRSTGKRH